jgi:hypothetical protein
MEIVYLLFNSPLLEHSLTETQLLYNSRESNLLMRKLLASSIRFDEIFDFVK